MGDYKRSCPACDAWTNSVGLAFRDGEPCPYCGLPADAARAIDEARDRHVNEDIVKRFADAEVRAVTAEAEVARLRGVLNNIANEVEFAQITVQP